MTTDSKSNGSDHRLVRHEELTDSVAATSDAVKSAFSQGRSIQERSAGLSNSAVIVWPHFSIGSDGRAYV